MPIHFHSEKTPFKLANKSRIKNWIESAIKKEKKKVDAINYIFCDDQHLLQINKQYLNHNYFTDIITFQYDQEASNLISGDIFISIDRVKENARNFGVRFNEELYRVMIHGILHLLGYKDKTTAAKKQMTKKENFYLNLLNEKS